jgi:DNA (cytosine-5)-methyltransferase 1
MTDETKPLRAIDLYSGIGGWSLGLTMAGVDVVASYEWWGPANQTNQINNQHSTTEIDIRSLPLNSLPGSIDFVVGSPPCTQFSYANRGGSGDIEDGLKDIEKFLEVVEYLKPRFWAMENVPRVAKILEREFSPSGRFERFVHLNAKIAVVDMCEWGIPQKRKRSIIGNFDFGLLDSYRSKTQKHSLGLVLSSLTASEVTDPIYGIKLNACDLVDHIEEMPLSREEARINREMKTFHPIYNDMSFPDPLDKPSRTITATCTRVSRESIVVPVEGSPQLFRRLTVRERGCIQGFPITYQFFGRSFQQKLKMIGNAVPPAFTYYVANAMLRTPSSELPSLGSAIKRFKPSGKVPNITPPDTEGAIYPSNRRFRAAIPNLRLKSGVRFEFSNSFEAGKVNWAVKLYFGNSKAIIEVPLDQHLAVRLSRVSELNGWVTSIHQSTDLVQALKNIDHMELQRSWCHSSPQGLGPFEVTDILGAAAGKMIAAMKENDISCAKVIDEVLAEYTSCSGIEKLRKNANITISGLIVGTAVNLILNRGAGIPSEKQRVA